MLAVRLERAEKCSRCGTSEWEWSKDRFAYEPISHRCHGCYVIDQAQKDVQPGDMVTQVILVPPAVAERKRSQPKRRPVSPRERVHA